MLDDGVSNPTFYCLFALSVYNFIINKNFDMWPPGHFYSPIPDLLEIKSKENEFFRSISEKDLGINFNVKEQLELFKKLIKYYKDIPFAIKKTDGLRYFYDNGNFSYGDATCLYSMIRHLKPKKIIEVGAGNSSCLILDTNELFFNNNISYTCIEPYSDRLLSMIKKEDLDKHEFIFKKLQDVPVEKFLELSKGDVLFIDTSHVSKIGSDVNYIFFEILPKLKRGVYIHFHDIFHSFEYPKSWVYEGWAWNENYILRAFLQYNNDFKIVFSNSFLSHFYHDKLTGETGEIPLWTTDMGSSFWLVKIGPSYTNDL